MTPATQYHLGREIGNAAYINGAVCLVSSVLGTTREQPFQIRGGIETIRLVQECYLLHVIPKKAIPYTKNTTNEII
jgi:hypothetical protein